MTLINHGITHPRQGYKITTTPHNLRNHTVGDTFSYSHAEVDEPVVCTVVAVCPSKSGSHNEFLIVENEAGLWAVSPHYHTGIDLFGVDADDEWWYVDTLHALSVTLDRPVSYADLSALLNDEILVPENRLPARAFLTPEQRLIWDHHADRTAPIMRLLTEEWPTPSQSRTDDQ
jgi:hypothetical protein